MRQSGQSPDCIAEVTTGDGYTLAATTFGDAATARASVLVAGAMGVEQRYYAGFARWLAGQGFFVATFDYRGMGRSRPEEYTLSFGPAEGRLTRLDAALTRFLSSEVAGGFVGTYVGLYATGNGAAAAAPAHFDWFDYEPGADK